MSTIIPSTRTASIQTRESGSPRPPAWVTSGPDTEGAYDGPTVKLDGGKLHLHIGWDPADAERTVAWLDCLEVSGAALDPYEMRVFALALMRAADIIDAERAENLAAAATLAGVTR